MCRHDDYDNYYDFDDSDAYLELERRRETFRRIDEEIAHERRQDRLRTLLNILLACGIIACVVVLGVVTADVIGVLAK